MKSIPVIDGISTGTALMKSVNDDMKMSAVDIFNIIASPSISFLSQDATELGRLILNYGIPKTTEDDVERGGEKGATSVSKIEPIASVETDQLNPTTPGVKKRNMADVIAAKLVGKQESRPKNSNPLSSQFEMEKHRKVEARMKKALAKELNERYDKTFMPKKSRSELKHTLKKLGESKRASSASVKPLDYEVLNHTFTPYKLRMIE